MIFATGSASLSDTFSPSASSPSPEEDAISDASSTETVVGSSLGISPSSASFSSNDAVLRGGVGPAVNSRSSSGVSSGRGTLSGATASADASVGAGARSSACSWAPSCSFPSMPEGECPYEPQTTIYWSQRLCTKYQNLESRGSGLGYIDIGNRQVRRIAESLSSSEAHASISI